MAKFDSKTAYKLNLDQPKTDIRATPGQGVSHQEFGFGVVQRKISDTEVSVKFKDDVKTVPLDSLTLGSGQKGLPSQQKQEDQRNTYHEDVNYAKAPESRPFVEWLWKNAELVMQISPDKAEEFSNWYKGETGEEPRGRGFYVDRQQGYTEEDRSRISGRVEWPKNKPVPEDITVPKELKVTLSGSGGGLKYHISSTAFVKQLIHNYGFRLGYQKGQFSPSEGVRVIQEETSGEAQTMDQSLDAVTQWFGQVPATA